MMDSGQEIKPAFHEIMAIRRQLEKFLKPLKTLCLNTIRENKDYYLETRRRETQLKQLPNSLKTEILGDEAHLEWGRWEHLLMNRRMTRLNIWLDPDEDVLAFCRFENSLMKKKPRLEEFIWTGTYNSRYDNRQDKFAFLAEHPTRRFAKLRSFSLHCTLCNDDHLQVIASHLKKLRTLRLELHDVTEKGIAAISTLKHLEEFPYEISHQKSDPSFKANIYSLCLKLIPRLKVIGEAICLETIDSDKEAELGESFYIDFQSFPTATKIGLRQLVLSREEIVIPEGITFPNLTSLVLIFPLENFQLDNRFSTVTELGLLELGMVEYLRILRIVGHQIRLLTILEEREDLALDQILHLCPKLEKLHIGMSPEILFCDSPLEPELRLLNLTELHLDLNNINFDIPTLAPGVLVQLFTAPNLCFIKLVGLDLNKEETDAIILLLQQGQILQNLQKLEVRHGLLLKGEHFNEELRSCYDLLLDNIVKHCPRFVSYDEMCIHGNFHSSCRSCLLIAQRSFILLGGNIDGLF